jgi:hypothetical protein
MIYALISYQTYNNGRGPVRYGSAPSVVRSGFNKYMADLAHNLSEMFDDVIAPNDIQIMSFTILTKEQFDQLMGDFE